MELRGGGISVACATLDHVAKKALFRCYVELDR